MGNSYKILKSQWEMPKGHPLADRSVDRIAHNLSTKGGNFYPFFSEALHFCLYSSKVVAVENFKNTHQFFSYFLLLPALLLVLFYMTSVIPQLIAFNCCYFFNDRNCCFAIANKSFQGMLCSSCWNHLEYNNAKRGFHLQCANQEFTLQEISSSCKI
jgi:hypothetical protein